jgi:hypothetical protein
MNSYKRAPFIYELLISILLAFFFVSAISFIA